MIKRAWEIVRGYWLLPRRLSDLLELAIEDLEKCEANGRYDIDMGHWHLPLRDGCAVCLAGGIMAQTMGVDVKTKVRYPWHRWPDYIAARMCALNSLREGEIARALEHIGRGSEPHPFTNENYPVPYEKDPEAFKSVMRCIANDLRREGY